MARNDGSDSDHSGGGGAPKKGKARRELPAGAVATLKAWLLSPEHFTHPYPTPQDQVMLMQQTGIDKKQLKNWFTNARRRIWKPMLKKQLEQGKIAGTGNGGMAVPGAIPGAAAVAGAGGTVDTHSAQSIQTHFQQAVQQQDQAQQYANPTYSEQQGTQANHPGAPQYQNSQQYYQYGQDGASAPAPMTTSGSIGSLPPMSAYSQGAASAKMSKNDSHAVLMELFARDQDLVRQAAESARMKAAAKGEQQATTAKVGSSSKLSGVPSMNSWPHFSSISSLNNLGQMTGVKSITSLSGADLASQGNLNKMGNLAQVKSMESMGKNDSYAFLEVFFGDRGMSSSTNLSAKQQDSGARGVKREREEDNDVGLSLDADESPSTTTMKQPVDSDAPRRAAGAPVPAPLPAPGNEGGTVVQESGTLKRAYDDALAARGLMSVSRSSEKLSDLALPVKMQRTLSQEFLRQHKQQQQQGQAPQFGQYKPPVPAAPANPPREPATQQYPGQNPGQSPQSPAPYAGPGSPLSDPTSANSSVEVSSATKCALCQKTNVDTQLRPCGHMFHERCLKPSLQNSLGQPTCPIDHMPMESALLAVPTDENTAQPPPPPQRAWNEPASPFQTANPSS